MSNPDWVPKETSDFRREALTAQRDMQFCLNEYVSVDEVVGDLAGPEATLIFDTIARPLLEQGHIPETISFMSMIAVCNIRNRTNAGRANG